MSIELHRVCRAVSTYTLAAPKGSTPARQVSLSLQSPAERTAILATSLSFALLDLKIIQEQPHVTVQKLFQEPLHSVLSHCGPHTTFHVSCS